MEVCLKLDNIKLENRPYTEVSPNNNYKLFVLGPLLSKNYPSLVNHLIWCLLISKLFLNI